MAILPDLQGYWGWDVNDDILRCIMSMIKHQIATRGCPSISPICLVQVKSCSSNSTIISVARKLNRDDSDCCNWSRGYWNRSLEKAELMVCCNPG